MSALLFWKNVFLYDTPFDSAWFLAGFPASISNGSGTPAVAASATAQRTGLSRRLVTVVEGESMVNDATGLVVYRFAVAVVVSGSFSLAQANWQFQRVLLRKTVA